MARSCGVELDASGCIVFSRRPLVALLGVSDLIVVAKGLGAGYQPIGAVLAQERITEAFRSGTGFFQHGHTYLAHVLACTASLAVQDAIREENLLPRVRAMGERLHNAQVARIGDHPAVEVLEPLQVSEQSIGAMNRDSGREVYEGPVQLRSEAIARDVPRPTQPVRRFTRRTEPGDDEVIDPFPEGLPFDPGAPMALQVG